MSTDTDVWIDVHDERESLLTMLEALTPVEWNTQSLCAEWRVRDVVGHLVSETTMSIPRLIVGTVGSGFRINKFIATDARRKGSWTEAELSMLSGLWCPHVPTCLGFRRCRCSRDRHSLARHPAPLHRDTRCLRAG